MLTMAKSNRHARAPIRASPQTLREAPPLCDQREAQQQRHHHEAGVVRIARVHRLVAVVKG